MQYKWINKTNNNNLIVFFNGWGMDEKIVENLTANGFDIIEFHDYRSFEFPNIDFSEYKNKYLVAWSMGVYVCNLFYDKFTDFNGYTAINGTLKPIDDNFGIPTMAYNMTVENFNELSCAKFLKKISSTADLKNYCSRSLEDLKQELISIRELKIKQFLPFNKAILSTKDRIFPFKNMFAFWLDKEINITEFQGSHYIFDSFKSWGDLI